MFALGIQLLVLLATIGLPLILAAWLLRTLSTLTSAVRDIGDRLARIERSLSDAWLTAPPNERRS